MHKDIRQKCSSFEEKSFTLPVPVLPHETKRRASSARIGARQDAGLLSSEELQWVREETEWERCSTTPHVARSVRLKNANERRRLQTLRLSLDRQLERELRRLDFERTEFVEALERASGRPRTAIVRSGTCQLFEPHESRSHGSSRTNTTAAGLSTETRPIRRAGFSANRLHVQITPNAMCASEGCSPNNPLPKPIWEAVRANCLRNEEVPQTKDDGSAVASPEHLLNTVLFKVKPAKREGRIRRLSHTKPHFFLPSGGTSSSDMGKSAQLLKSPSVLRYPSAGAPSQKRTDV